MAALATFKEDLNEPIQSPYVGYYFPVNERRFSTEGAWLRSYKQEQKRRFNAVVCKNYKTLDEIKSQVHGTVQSEQQEPNSDATQEEKKLNGFFLLKHCFAEDPCEVFCININDQGFSTANPEDFLLFDKVQCISARENRLTLEIFKTFIRLQELELPLNGINSLRLKYGDFPYLQHLDLSFNNLAGDSLKSLGLMPNLITLNLSGNGITELPTDFAKCFRLSTSHLYLRFPRLRILKLDNNKLWRPETFLSLGSLPQLQHLDLENNQLYHVPQLYSQNGKVGLFEEVHRSTLEEDFSASDIDDANRALEDFLKYTDDLLKRVEDLGISTPVDREKIVKKEKKTLEQKVLEIGEHTMPDSAKERTNEFLDALLSDVNGENDDLVSEASRDDSFDRASCLSNLSSSDESTQRSTHRSLVPIPVETSIESHDSNRSYCYKTQPVRVFNKTCPPFNHLLSLNLANNKFTNEEAFVAIAAWPTIRALIIRDNPLIKNTPIRKMTLIKAILVQKLGIRVISKLPSTPSQHRTEFHQNYMRTVKGKVRKLPKLSVDEILALESKPDDRSPSGQSFSARSDRSKFSDIISGRSLAGGHHEENERSKTSPEGAEQYETENMSEGYDADQEDGTFFMTQPSDEPVPIAKEKSTAQPKRIPVISEFMRQQYRDYAVLFEDEDEDEDENNCFVLPKKGIQSNVQALRYALDHQLTILDHPKSIETHKIQPSRHHPPIRGSDLNYERRIASVLKNIKQGTAVEEVPLGDIFSDPVTHKKDFKEAKKLLREVESHYNQKAENPKPKEKK